MGGSGLLSPRFKVTEQNYRFVQGSSTAEMTGYVHCKAFDMLSNEGKTCELGFLLFGILVFLWTADQLLEMFFLFNRSNIYAFGKKIISTRQPEYLFLSETLKLLPALLF